MRFSEVAPRDWHLYFQGTWMYHEPTAQVVQIQLEDDGIQFRPSGVRSWSKAKPESLLSFWPKPMSINLSGKVSESTGDPTPRAAYVGRRPRREARRSATMGHYYITWGTRSFNPSMFTEMLEPFVYPTFEEAQELLNSNSSDPSNSVALSRDLIIDARQRIVIGGLFIGTLKDAPFSTYELVPFSKNVPLTKRALLKLSKVNVICR